MLRTTLVFRCQHSEISTDAEGVMAYITVAQARARSRAEWANSRIAEKEIRKSASTSIDTIFDVFLSHSFEDAEVIAGVKGFIEDQGLRVYVDWIEDPQADRSCVTAATAEMLRRRMNRSQSLLYASSDAATKSKWMPWELGYFDGRNPGRVGDCTHCSAGRRTLLGSGVSRFVSTRGTN